MPQVSVTLNSRVYRLGCAEGDEQRVAELANFVKDKIDRLTQEFGQVGEDRLLLMTAILIADELWDARGGAPAPPADGADDAERRPLASGLLP